MKPVSRRLITAALVFFLLAVPVTMLFSLDTVTVFGRLIDYAWAHTADRLAVLFLDPNNSSVIFVIDGERGDVKERYFLPDEYEYNSFDWTSEDDAFLLCGPLVDKYPSGSILRFNRTDRSYAEIETDVNLVFIDNVAAEGGSDRWAAAYSGEGHPDIYFFQGEEIILQTDVYPGIITLVDWQDGKAYCMSDIRIDYGLTLEKREQNFTSSDEAAKGTAFHESSYYADERLRLYSIDPENGVAEISDKYYKDILGTSVNGKHYVKFDQINIPNTDFSQLTVTIF